MSVRAERIKVVIERKLLPEEKIIKLMNDYLLWELLSVDEYDTLSALMTA